MAEKTYNAGRVVGWSSYEEFLKETGMDPNVITNYVYQTLVTYGVTRVVELSANNWVPSHGGKFYTQTVQVPGASWGAVPIVGLDYEAYMEVIATPGSTDSVAEAADEVDKAAVEDWLKEIICIMEMYSSFIMCF